MFSSCLVCLHEVPMLEENYDEGDDEEEYENNMVRRDSNKNILIKFSILGRN